MRGNMRGKHHKGKSIMQNFKDHGRSQEAKMANDQMDAFRKRAAAIRSLGEWAENVAAGAGAVAAEASTSNDAQLIAVVAQATGKTEAEVRAKLTELMAG